MHRYFHPIAVFCLGLSFLTSMPGRDGLESAVAQTNSPDEESLPQEVHEAESVLQEFEHEQQSLARDFRETARSGPAGWEAWGQRNAGRLSAQQERAALLAIISAVEPWPLPPASPVIPADASPALREFLIARSNAADLQVQIHNELIDTLPLEVREEQIAAMQEQEHALLRQHNEQNIENLNRTALTLAAESAARPLPTPALPDFPPGASPDLIAFLTMSHQTMREHVEIWNRNPNSAARDLALDQWMKDNAVRIEQTQTVARRISQ